MSKNVQLPGAGGNQPNPPPLPGTGPLPPPPPVPASWDDFGRQAAALFEILSKKGRPAAESFQRWLAAERGKP